MKSAIGADLGHFEPIIIGVAVYKYSKMSVLALQVAIGVVSIVVQPSTA